MEYPDAESKDGVKTVQLYTRNSNLSYRPVVKLEKKEDFDFTVQYDATANVADGLDGLIFRVKVGGLTSAVKKHASLVDYQQPIQEITFELNDSGMLSVKDGKVIFKPVHAAKKPETYNSTTATEPEIYNSTTAVEPEGPKEIVERLTFDIVHGGIVPMTEERINAGRQRLDRYDQADRKRLHRATLYNTLEGKPLRMRDLLEEVAALNISTTDERDAVTQVLESLTDWLRRPWVQCYR